MATQKIFIIHGWTYTLDKWTDIIAELETRNFEPQMLKVPGLTSLSDEVWDVEKYVEWLQAELGDSEDVVILGHSNGGRIAMAFDQKYPNRIKQLFLMDSAGVPRTETKASLKRKVGKLVAKAIKPFLPMRLRRKLARIIGASDYTNAKPNMRETMLKLWEHDKTFDPSGVTAPTTLIWGENDSATPLKDGELLRSTIPNADDLHVIAGAGHSPQGDEPSQIADIIASKLEAS